MTEVSTVCVDIGNSGMRCVLVPSSPHANTTTPWLGEILRIDWPAEHDADAIKSLIKHAVSAWLKPHAFPTRWLVSSVQRTMEGYLRTVAGDLKAIRYHRVDYRDLKLDVQVDYPDKVGIDRLLAALAASEQSPHEPTIVIQAGSAITVDWFQPPRTFCGGAIMPGVPMMLRLLSKAADLLPEVAAKELLNLPPLPGKNTTAAMNAGASSAVVGGVQHLVARYREQYGQDTLVVISGGDGPLLSPHIDEPIKVVDHLVLRGLALLSELL